MGYLFFFSLCSFITRQDNNTENLRCLKEKQKNPLKGQKRPRVWFTEVWYSIGWEAKGSFSFFYGGGLYLEKMINGIGFCFDF